MKTAAFIFALLLSNCATLSKPIFLEPGAEKILVSRLSPPSDYKLLMPLESEHGGGGCGGFGSVGQIESAINAMKNQAAQIKADYVQIINVKRPKAMPGCYSQGYVLKGNAYQKQ